MKIVHPEPPPQPSPASDGARPGYWQVIFRAGTKKKREKYSSLEHGFDSENSADSP
jgi:hypothetical protein